MHVVVSPISNYAVHLAKCDRLFRCGWDDTVHETASFPPVLARVQKLARVDALCIGASVAFTVSVAPTSVGCLVEGSVAMA